MSKGYVAENIMFGYDALEFEQKFLRDGEVLFNTSLNRINGNTIVSVGFEDSSGEYHIPSILILNDLTGDHACLQEDGYNYKIAHTSYDLFDKVVSVRVTKTKQ